jgi:transcriptional regulator with XRE-family HTH domain
VAYRLEDQDAPTREALVALGSVFIELRRTRGLSQRKLAARSGLSQSTISRLETGKAPWLSAVWIARVLAGLDLEPGILGFRGGLTKSSEPGWATLMRRFDRARRDRDIGALSEEQRVRREAWIERERRALDIEGSIVP